MKMTRLILLCLAAFVLGLVAFIPAELLELPVNRALAGRGQFSAEAGTVWSGQGFLTWREADLPAPIKVRWQWDPLALLQLSAGAHLQWDSAALSGKTAIA
ncbi:MAG: hypothetical protein JNM52_00615, partial [Betaproteobacteria bacterium]|nr:hypothetical protein [Betaproteobacteria bacterium]